MVHHDVMVAANHLQSFPPTMARVGITSPVEGTKSVQSPRVRATLY